MNGFAVILSRNQPAESAAKTTTTDDAMLENQTFDQSQNDSALQVLPQSAFSGHQKLRRVVCCENGGFERVGLMRSDGRVASALDCRAEGGLLAGNRIGDLAEGICRAMS